MLGDPLQFLVIAGNGSAWAWDLKYILSKSLFALAMGLIVFSIVKDIPAASVSTLAACFLGFFTYRLNHPAYFSLCYAPWPLYCWINYSDSKTVKRSTIWAVVLIFTNLFLLTSGTIKESYILFLTINSTGGLMVLINKTNSRTKILKLIGVCLAGILLTFLTYPWWGSFYDTLLSTSTNNEKHSIFQIQSSVIIGFFDELFYRSVNDGKVLFNPSVNFLILYGIIYFFITIREQILNRYILAVALATIVTISIVFGFISPNIISNIPFIKQIARIDHCFSCTLIILSIILSGAGFSFVAKRIIRADAKKDIFIISLFVYFLIFFFFSFTNASQIAGINSTRNYSHLKPGETIPLNTFTSVYLCSLIVALGIFHFTLNECISRKNVTTTTATLLLTSLSLLLWRHGLQAGEGFSDYVIHPPSRSNFYAISDGVSRIQNAVNTEPSRVIGLESNLFPGWSAAYSIEGINGPDALHNIYYSDLLNNSPLDVIWGWRVHLTQENLNKSQAILNMLNVGYILDDHKANSLEYKNYTKKLSIDFNIYQNNKAWPRAFYTDYVYGYKTVNEFLNQIIINSDKPFGAIQIKESESEIEHINSSRSLKLSIVVPATNYQLTENSTTFEIYAPHPGWVVLTETFWPGYSHVTIDSRNTACIRMNHAFQGLWISKAGKHKITVNYHPRGMLKMQIISVTVFIILLTILIVSLI
jgi:hypothetical protein